VSTDYELDSLSDLQMEFTLGLLPQAAYDVLTNQDNKIYSRAIKGRPLLVSGPAQWRDKRCDRPGPSPCLPYNNN
ncbi:unnamed protein product, partial [Brassica oleracea var. botrytis]